MRQSYVHPAKLVLFLIASWFVQPAQAQCVDIVANDVVSHSSFVCQLCRHADLVIQIKNPVPTDSVTSLQIETEITGDLSYVTAPTIVSYDTDSTADISNEFVSTSRATYTFEFGGNERERTVDIADPTISGADNNILTWNIDLAAVDLNGDNSPNDLGFSTAGNGFREEVFLTVRLLPANSFEAFADPNISLPEVKTTVRYDCRGTTVNAGSDSVETEAEEILLVEPNPILSRHQIDFLGGAPNQFIPTMSESNSVAGGQGSVFIGQLQIPNHIPPAVGEVVPTEDLLINLSVTNRAGELSSAIKIQYFCSSLASAEAIAADSMSPDPNCTAVALADDTYTLDVDDPFGNPGNDEVNDFYADTLASRVPTEIYYVAEVDFAGASCTDLMVHADHAWGCEADGPGLDPFGLSPGGGITVPRADPMDMQPRDLFIRSLPDASINVKFYLVHEDDPLGVEKTTAYNAYGIRARMQFVLNNNSRASIRNLGIRMDLIRSFLYDPTGGGAKLYITTRADCIPGSGDPACVDTSDADALDAFRDTHGYPGMPDSVWHLNVNALCVENVEYPDGTTAPSVQCRYDAPRFVLITESGGVVTLSGTTNPLVSNAPPIPNGDDLTKNVVRDLGPDFRYILEVPVVFSFPTVSDVQPAVNTRWESPGNGDPFVSNNGAYRLLTESLNPGIGREGALENIFFFYADSCNTPVKTATVITNASERISLEGAEIEGGETYLYIVSPDVDVNIIPLDASSQPQGDVTANGELNILLPPDESQTLQVRVRRSYAPAAVVDAGGLNLTQEAVAVLVTVGAGLTATIPAGCAPLADGGAFYLDQQFLPAPAVNDDATIYRCQLMDPSLNLERNYDFSVAHNLGTMSQDLTFRADIFANERHADGMSFINALPGGYLTPIDPADARLEGNLQRIILFTSADSIVARIIGIDYESNLTCTHHDHSNDPNDRAIVNPLLIGEDCEVQTTFQFFGLDTPGMSIANVFSQPLTVNPNNLADSPSFGLVDHSAVDVVVTPSLIRGGATIPIPDLATVPAYDAFRLGLNAANTAKATTQSRIRLLNTGTVDSYANNHGDRINLTAALQFDLTIEPGLGNNPDEEIPVDSSLQGVLPHSTLLADFNVPYLFEVREPNDQISLTREECRRATPPVNPPAACASFTPSSALDPIETGSGQDILIRTQINYPADPADSPNFLPAYNLSFAEEIACQISIPPSDSDGLDNDGDGMIDGADLTGEPNVVGCSPADTATLLVDSNSNADFASYAIGGMNDLYFLYSIGANLAPGQSFASSGTLTWDSAPTPPIDPTFLSALNLMPTGERAGFRQYSQQVNSFFTIPRPSFTVNSLPGLSISDAVDHRDCVTSGQPCTGLGPGEDNVQLAAIGEEVELRLLANLPAANYRNLVVQVSLPEGVACIAVDRTNISNEEVQVNGISTPINQTFVINVPSGTPTVRCDATMIEWDYGDVMIDTGEDFQLGLRALIAVENHRDNIHKGNALRFTIEVGDATLSYQDDMGNPIVLSIIGSDDERVRLTLAPQPLLEIMSKEWSYADGTPLPSGSDSIEVGAEDELLIRVVLNNRSRERPWNIRYIDRFSQVTRGGVNQWEYVANSFRGISPTNTPPTINRQEDLIFTWPQDHAIYDDIVMGSLIEFEYRIRPSVVNQPNQFVSDSFDDADLDPEQTTEIAWSGVSRESGLAPPLAMPAISEAEYRGVSPYAYGNPLGPRTGTVPNAVDDNPNNYQEAADPALFSTRVFIVPKLTLGKMVIGAIPGRAVRCERRRIAIGGHACIRITIDGSKGTMHGVRLSEESINSEDNTPDQFIPEFSGDPSDPLEPLQTANAVASGSGATITLDIQDDQNFLIATWGGDQSIDQPQPIVADPNVAEAFRISLDYFARVENVAANRINTPIKSGNVTLTYDDGDGVGSLTETANLSDESGTAPAFRVAEPELTISYGENGRIKNIMPGPENKPPAGGDRLEVPVLLTASMLTPSSVASVAHDVVLYVRASEDLTYVPGSFKVDGIDRDDLVVDDASFGGNRYLRFGINGGLDIGFGESINASYELQVSNTVQASQKLGLIQGVTWTSQDGEDPNERDGSDCLALVEDSAILFFRESILIDRRPNPDDLNDYCAIPSEDLEGLETDDQTMLETTISEGFDPANDGIVRVGDLITFTTNIRVNRGVTSQLEVSAQLPAGLAFVNGLTINEFPANIGLALDAFPALDPLDRNLATGRGFNEQTWLLDFGDVTNPGGGDDDIGEFIRIVWQTRATADSLKYQASTPLMIDIRVEYESAVNDSELRQELIAITVLQPIMEVLATNGIVERDNNPTNGGESFAGALIQFRTTACVTGDAPAYNLRVGSVFDPQYVDVSTLGQFSDNAQVSIVDRDGVSIRDLGNDLYDSSLNHIDGSSEYILTLGDGEPVEVGQCLQIEFDINNRETIGIGNSWDHEYDVREFHSLPLGGNEDVRQTYTSASTPEGGSPLPTAIFTLKTPIEFPEPPSLSLTPASPSPIYLAIGEAFTLVANIPGDRSYEYAMRNVRAELTSPLYTIYNNSLVYSNDGTIRGLPSRDPNDGLNPLKFSILPRFVAGDQAVVNVAMRVANSAQAQEGFGVDGSFDLSYTFRGDAEDSDGTPITFPRDTDDPETTLNNALMGAVRVVEPQLDVVRNFFRLEGDVITRSAAGTAIDAGDLIEVELQISAMGGAPDDNFSNAFDLSIVDSYPAEVEYFANSTRTRVAGVDNVIGEPVEGAGILTWAADDNAVDIDITEGEMITFRYVVRVSDTAQPLQLLAFSANVRWTSLDGASDLERTGTGGLNDYVLDSAADVEVSDNTSFALAWISDSYQPADPNDPDIRIGDVVLYRLTSNLQEGTTRGVTIDLTLPEGMEFLRLGPMANVDVRPLNLPADLTPVAGVNPVTRSPTLSFTLGDFENAGTSQSGAGVTGSFTLDFYLRTLNQDVFDPEPLEQLLTTTGLGRFIDGQGRPTLDGLPNLNSAVDVNLVQPKMTIELDFTTSRDPDKTVPLGFRNTINWMLTLDNSAGMAPAYNPEIVSTVPLTSRQVMLNAGDQLEAILTFPDQPGAPPITLTTMLDATFMATGELTFMTVDLPNPVVIPPGSRAVLTYSTEITNEVGAGMRLENASNIEVYYSLDDQITLMVDAIDVGNPAPEDYGPTDASSTTATALTPEQAALPIEILTSRSTVSIGEPFPYFFNLPGTEDSGDAFDPAEVALYDIIVFNNLIDPAENRNLRFVSVSYVIGADPSTDPPVLENIAEDDSAIIQIAGTQDQIGLDILAGEQAEFSLTVLPLDVPGNMDGVVFVNTASFTYARLDDMDDPMQQPRLDGGMGTSGDIRQGGDAVGVITIVEPSMVLEGGITYARGMGISENLASFDTLIPTLLPDAADGDGTPSLIRFDRTIINRFGLVARHATAIDLRDGTNTFVSTGPAYDVTFLVDMPGAGDQVGMCEFDPSSETIVVEVLDVAEANESTNILRTITPENITTTWQPDPDCELRIQATGEDARVQTNEFMRVRFTSRLDMSSRDGSQLVLSANLSRYSSYSALLYDEDLSQELRDELGREIRQYNYVPPDSDREATLALSVEAPELILLKRAINLTAQADLFRREVSSQVNATLAQAGDEIRYELTLINIGRLPAGIDSASTTPLTLIDQPEARRSLDSLDAPLPSGRVWSRQSLRNPLVLTGIYPVDDAATSPIDAVRFDALNLVEDRDVNEMVKTRIAFGESGVGLTSGTADRIEFSGFSLDGRSPNALTAVGNVLRFEFTVQIRGDAPDQAVGINQAVLANLDGFATDLLSHQYRDGRTVVDSSDTLVSPPINACYDVAIQGVKPDCTESAPDPLTTEILSRPLIQMAKRVFDVDGDEVYDVGDRVRYEIIAINTGTVNSTQTRIIDHVPAGMSYVPQSTYLNGILVSDVVQVSDSESGESSFISALEEGLLISAVGETELPVQTQRAGLMRISMELGGELSDDVRHAVISFEATINPDQIAGSLIANQAYSRGASDLRGFDATSICNVQNPPLTEAECNRYREFSNANSSYSSPPSDDPTTEASNDPTVLAVGVGPQLAVTMEVVIDQINNRSDAFDATDTFIYTIVIRNIGGVDLSKVRVSHIIPPEMRYILGSTFVNTFESEERLGFAVPDIHVGGMAQPAFFTEEDDTEGGLFISDAMEETAIDEESAVIAKSRSASVTFRTELLGQGSDGEPLESGDIISSQAFVYTDEVPTRASDADNDPSNGFQPTQLVYGAGQLLDIDRRIHLVDGNLALPDSQIEHRFIMRNIGSDPITDIVLTDTFSKGRTEARYVYGSLQINGLPISESDEFVDGCANVESSLLDRINQSSVLNYDDANGTLRLNFGLIGNIQVGRSVTITYRTEILPTAQQGKEMRFDASVQWQRNENLLPPIADSQPIFACNRVSKTNEKPDNFTSLSTSLDVGGTTSGAVVSGAVWRDINHNLDFDFDSSDNNPIGEVGEAGWVVNLVLNEELLESRAIDQDGEYRFIGVASSPLDLSEYSIEFIPVGNHPEYAIVGIPDYFADTNREDKQGNIEPDDMAIRNFSVENKRNYVNLNLPVDPDGVVYDSVTREVVPDSRVNLYYVGDANAPPIRVPPTCFDDPKQHNQVTGIQGYYRFDLNFSSDSQCPNQGGYVIHVESPQTDLFLQRFPSFVFPPASTVANSTFNTINESYVENRLEVLESTAGTGLATPPIIVSTCEGLQGTIPITDAQPSSPPCDINASHLVREPRIPTREGTLEDVRYGLYTQANDKKSPLDRGGEIITGSRLFQNNIPLDPNLSRAVLISKSTNLTSVIRGQLVPYTITLRNTLDGPLVLARIEDHMPPGFKYIADTGTLDGVLYNPSRISGTTLFWDDIELIAGQVRVLQLILIVGGGVSEGEYVNTARVWEASTRQYSSVPATATVRVVPDPFFDCADIIGRVFDDKNRNATLDSDEPGLAGARVVTTSGLRITTDEYGRFNIPCPVIPNVDRGTNFYVKLDEQTLPIGYRLTTDNPRVLRSTRGKMLKYNFGASLHRVVRLDLSDPAFVLGEAKLESLWLYRIDQVIEELRGEPSILRISYLGERESADLAEARLKLVYETVQQKWFELQCCYNLEIEIETYWRLGRPGEIDEDFVPLPVDVRRSTKPSQSSSEEQPAPNSLDDEQSSAPSPDQDSSELTPASIPSFLDDEQSSAPPTDQDSSELTPASIPSFLDDEQSSAPPTDQDSSELTPASIPSFLDDEQSSAPPTDQDSSELTPASIPNFLDDEQSSAPSTDQDSSELTPASIPAFDDRKTTQFDPFDHESLPKTGMDTPMPEHLVKLDDFSCYLLVEDQVICF